MSRRGKGEDSVYKRKRDNRWMVQVMDPISGKRKYYCATPNTRAAAYAKLEEARGRLKNGQALPDERLTVGKYLDDWLKHSQERHNLQDSSQKRCSEALRKHVIPALGKVKLTDLTRPQVRAFLDRLKTEPQAGIGRPLALASVRKVRTVLRTALQDAFDDDLVLRNVADGIRLPADKRQDERPIYTPVQANHLLATARGHWWEALYWLELQTGMRESELLNLTWDDVDLARRVLTIRKSKTDAGVRKVGLIPQVVEQLRKHQERQLFEKKKMGPRWQEQGLVFPNTIGKRQEVCRFLDDHYQLLERAELPRIHFHDLRHTAISWLLSLGIPVVDVAKFVGHADVTTTLRRYAHALPDSQQAILAALEQVLSGGILDAQAVK